MKKRALSLLLCLVFLVGLMPTTALAAGGATDTWDVDLVVSKNTAVQYNGQDTVEIGFGVQSDNLKVKSVASIFFAFDMDVFEFIARDPSDSSGNTYFSYESSDYQDTLSSELTDFTYQLYSTGSGKSYLKWSAKAYIAKKGTTGYFLFQPNCGKETACTDKIILASVLFALKPGKTFDDISSTSIRLATKDEVAQYNQTAAVEITNGDGISKYAILKDGTTDTLNKTPAVVWNDITPSKPAKTTPTCVAPTGVTAPFGSALSTITLTNPTGNTAGKWYWMGNTQKVGNVKDNPHTYKAKFVPNDAANFSTVENIDVTVNATQVVLGAGSPIMIPIEVYYTGSAIEPTPKIMTELYGDELVLNQDYKITKYENNTSVGTGKIFIAPLTNGNYSFTAGSYTFTIKQATGSVSIADPGAIAYDGSAVEAGTSGKDLTYTYKGDGSVTVKWYADNSGTKGSELTGGAPKDAGTYWIGVSVADGTNYLGVSEVTKKFTIARADYTYTYTGSTAASIGSARPAGGSATASGVGSETVSGTLSWYTDSTCNTAASGNFTTAGNEDLYWKFTPDTAETNYVTTPKTGKVTFNISTLPAQEVTFANATVTKTFGDGKFTETATNSTSGGGTITYSGNNNAVATVNSSTGEVTIVGVGTVTITATAAATATHSAGQASYTLTVEPKAITPTVTVSGTYKFKGNPITPTYTVEITTGETLPSDQYDVEITNNTNAGNGNIKIKAKTGGNYSFDVNQTFAIAKADALTSLPDITVTQKYTVTTEQSKDIGRAGMPENAGTLTYNLGTTSKTGSASVTPSMTGSTVKFTITGGANGEVITLPVTITSDNYKDSIVNVKVTLTDKDIPTVAANDITVTYDGNAIPDSKITGTATFGGTSVPGTWAWKTGMAVTNVADTGTKTVTFNPTDSAAYESVDTNITVTINKATPTGEPTYTAITTSGKKLSDAALDIGSITPTGGTIKWDLGNTTEVTANTAYNWTYTLADANYDKLTGTITPYVVSYSGGGSYTPTYAITVDKAANGTVTVTPGTAKTGDTVTLTATPDKGYELDIIKALDKDGKSLKLTDQGNGKYTFTMPAGKVTVKAVFEDSNLVMFDDVSKEDYCYEAVKWAVKNSITSGIGNNRFGPNDPCTRGQIVTFLWRAAGSPEPKSMSSFSDVPADSYYAKAVAWAVEKGITSGTGDGKFSPEDPCTRAQSVTFLYRAAGSPAVIGSAEFSDVESDTYYAAAVAWAAKNGITSGTGGGQFGSDDECSRGHIVTFLFNAYGK